jgi:hypothetical protein
MNFAPPFHVLASLHSFRLGKEYFPKLIIRVNGPSNTSMGATDSRDRIFALLGAADNTYGLVPDYTKDMTRVFLDTTIAILENGQFWPLIYGIYGQDSSNPNWPSWMVDWSSISQRTDKHFSLSRSFDGHIARDEGGKTEWPFISFQVPPSGQSTESAKPRMFIKGLIVSAVACVTSSFRELESQIKEIVAKDEMPLSELLLQLDPFMLLLKAWLESLHSSMTNICIGGTDSGVADRIADVIMSFLASPSTPATLLTENFQAMLSGVITSLITDSDHRLGLAEGDAQKFMERLVEVLTQLITTYVEHKKERWVILQNGFIGQTAFSVEEEDIVTLFIAPSDQQSAIFVLRKVEDDLYRIIGKVHMADVDRDEFWEEHREIVIFSII